MCACARALTSTCEQARITNANVFPRTRKVSDGSACLRIDRVEYYVSCLRIFFNRALLALCAVLCVLFALSPCIGCTGFVYWMHCPCVLRVLFALTQRVDPIAQLLARRYFVQAPIISICCPTSIRFQLTAYCVLGSKQQRASLARRSDLKVFAMMMTWSYVLPIPSVRPPAARPSYRLPLVGSQNVPCSPCHW